MLKDYYKIFGVKEDASEQEIHARWIELMRHYHPDVQKGMQFDEISKEINEAYEILKDPFTRADYDHNLAQHRSYGGKRVSHRLGFVFLGSIFFIAIIYMVITPSKTFVPSVSQPIRRNIAPPQIENKVSDVIVEVPRTQGPKHDPTQESVTRGRNDAEINHKDEKQTMVENDQTNLTNQTNQTDQKNQINPINQVKVEVKDKIEVKDKVEVKKGQPDSINPIGPSNSINSMNQVKDEVKVQKGRPDSIDPINPSNSINPSNPTNPINSINQPKVEVKNNQTNQINQTDQRTPVTKAKAEAKPKDKVDLVKNRPSPIKPVTQVEVKAEHKVQKNSINPTDSINPTNQQKAKVEKSQTNLTNQTNKTDQSNSSNQPKVKAEVKAQKSSTNQINERNQIDQRNPVTQAKAEPKVTVQKNQTNQINQIDQRNQKDPINQPKPKVAVKENSSNSINSINPINPSNPSNPRNTTNPLIARDEEVRKFFTNYVGRYNRKDLIGFMSFFSNRAIQNQKEGLEGIKKIYFTFFNQSLELKYRLSDLKIEVYQNAINVKAQYELDQLSKNGRRNAFRGSIQWVLAREGEGLKIVSLDYQQTKGESHEI